MIKDTTARYLRAEYKNKIETGTLSTSKPFFDVAQKAIERMEHELAIGTGKVAYKDYIGALTKYHIPFFNRTYITSIDQDKLRDFNVKREDGKEGSIQVNNPQS